MIFNFGKNFPQDWSATETASVIEKAPVLEVLSAVRMVLSELSLQYISLEVMSPK